MSTIRPTATHRIRFRPAPHFRNYQITGVAHNAMQKPTNSCHWTIEVSASDSELVGYFQHVHRARMQNLPICNPRLKVESVGFREFEGHELGVLITPWFMNLVLLPGPGSELDLAEGSASEWAFPSGQHQFFTCRDDALGTYLTAVLFSSVNGFPDQAIARAIADEVLIKLFTDRKARANEKTMSRRDLFSGASAS